MIAVFLFLVQLCFAEVAPTGGASPEETKQQLLQEKIAALNAEIEQLRQENLSCRSTKDCFSLELGSKACGGPESYIVLSKRNKSISRIKDKAKEYLELKKAYHPKGAVTFSTCSFVGPSDVACLNKKCQEVPQ